MNNEDIIRMARKAGFQFSDEDGPLLANHAEWQRQLLERFAALVAAAEREACAKVCDKLWSAAECAEAIRARGQA
jgi:hypothetical protein